jgi:hypothetical protein
MTALMLFNAPSQVGSRTDVMSARRSPQNVNPSH